MRNYYFEITTRKGDTETTESYLTQLSDDLTENRLELLKTKMLIDWYPNGTYYNDSKEYVMFPEGFACYYGDFYEIEDSKFEVLNTTHNNMVNTFAILNSQIELASQLLLDNGFEEKEKSMFDKTLRIKSPDELFYYLDKVNLNEEQIDVDYDGEGEESQEITVTVNLLLVNESDIKNITYAL